MALEDYHNLAYWADDEDSAITQRGEDEAGTMAENTALIVTTLQSIDATLKELLALSKTKRAATPSPTTNLGAPIREVASDADLDSTHGDPIVKFMPRDWTGDEYRQQPFSATTPEFLEMLANVYDGFFAKKTAANDPKAKWEAITAARARGWAARLRAGWKRDEVASGDIKW